MSRTTKPKAAFRFRSELNSTAREAVDSFLAVKNPARKDLDQLRRIMDEQRVPWDYRAFTHSERIAKSVMASLPHYYEGDRRVEDGRVLASFKFHFGDCGT